MYTAWVPEKAGQRRSSSEQLSGPAEGVGVSYTKRFLHCGFCGHDKSLETRRADINGVLSRDLVHISSRKTENIPAVTETHAGYS
ncbi:hypothetical protein E2C01_013987 [Portunus trituberculatus]|uniref:Uncharacterized protein n=1 Tax=Portunus trituberculatus TaxID=210409 RepID=A0A5B7DIN7_PORTR|nr:hypothetical protein [Portunus trituberculatus]